MLLHFYYTFKNVKVLIYINTFTFFSKFKDLFSLEVKK